MNKERGGNGDDDGSVIAAVVRATQRALGGGASVAAEDSFAALGIDSSALVGPLVFGALKRSAQRLSEAAEEGEEAGRLDAARLARVVETATAFERLNAAVDGFDDAKGLVGQVEASCGLLAHAENYPRLQVLADHVKSNAGKMRAAFVHEQRKGDRALLRFFRVAFDTPATACFEARARQVEEYAATFVGEHAPSTAAYRRGVVAYETAFAFTDADAPPDRAAVMAYLVAAGICTGDEEGEEAAWSAALDHAQALGLVRSPETPASQRIYDCLGEYLMDDMMPTREGLLAHCQASGHFSEAEVSAFVEHLARCLEQHPECAGYIPT